VIGRPRDTQLGGCAARRRTGRSHHKQADDYDRQ
jgi:hypothetical protein